MKPSEFYSATEHFRAEAVAGEQAAFRAVRYFQGVAQQVQATRDRADEHGLPPDASERLDAFRKMLAEGPPDGSPLGGDGAVKAAEEPRGRSACPECGSRGRHRRNPPCSKGLRPAPMGPVPQHAPKPDPRKEEDAEKVSLAGDLRVLLEDGPQSIADLMLKTGASRGELDEALKLLGFPIWKTLEGTTQTGPEKWLALLARGAVAGGHIPSDVAKMLGVEMPVLVRCLNGPA
jgi:hypothetical protein